ncbi:NADH-quinone oxidoreductase subunit NuoN [Fictibacillus sp. KU28468]|uniref:NADH-quinone oxidoreductase subunit NuoN n=1 Tax=Fictibacillus sp. KU28468 TaxID=2991053 RepID=UPI00223C9EE0|nr:NADH-quinone oxidoreductase subunit NuoN [Fictibacillus sp. KU28468]UZJ79205.1 NADH-quinone oxidoreductase subunit NuoN [Fictibacillus sp. KU28468]
MDLHTLTSMNWGIMAPEFAILGTAIILSLLDLFMPRTRSRRPLGILAIAGIAAAFIFLYMQFGHEGASLFHDMYRLDSFSKAFKQILLLGTGLILVLAYDYRMGEEEEYRGEFYYLLLTALLGAMFMASSGDMITLFIGLELLSLSSYVMAGMRKRKLESNEAAFKYVVTGGISTAITMFGMSYVFGLTGETNLYAVGAALRDTSILQNQFLLVFAFFITFAGLTFKIASAPFHMWAPDVYQGSPLPVTAFLSVVSKTAGFAIILRFFLMCFSSAPGIKGDPLLLQVQPYLAVLAGATMIAGNVIALRQRNIKRLFAYSSVAQAGYILVPFVSVSALLFETTWFYLLAYLFMNIGAFAVIQEVTAASGTNDISGFAGLYKRSPWLAFAMTIFILSLAGIPATAGFAGKFGIFMNALGTNPGHYILAGILMAATVVSYFYYFNIIGQMFFRSGQEERAIQHKKGLLFVTALCAAATMFFGIFPGTALHFFYNEFHLTDFFQTLGQK